MRHDDRLVSSLAENDRPAVAQNDLLQDGIHELVRPEADQKVFEILHVVADCGRLRMPIDANGNRLPLVRIKRAGAAQCAA